MFCSKVWGKQADDIADDSTVRISRLTSHLVLTSREQELEDSQTAILLTEEVLLEALCFDFVVQTPQTNLIDLLEARPESIELEEYAFSIANDS